MGNLYATVTKGYKSGGYNTQMFSDFLQQRIMSEMGMAMLYDAEATVSYRPETDWNYELGAHLNLLDGRISADLAAFWLEIDNQQVTMFPEGSITGRIMANAGRSRSRGVEVSASYHAPAGWFARGSWGFTDARFIRFNNGRADYSGKRVPYAPRNTLFLGTGWRRGFNGIIDRLELEADLTGTGRIQWDEANTVSQPFYALLNASAAVSHRDFTLRLWGRNLTGTRYSTFYFVSIGNAFTQRGDGCAVGLSLLYNTEF